MKKPRKIIAVLLAAMMLFILPVSASAVDGDTYVDGFWNGEEQYCLRIGNFGLVILTNYVSANLPEDNTWVIRLKCRADDGATFICAIDSSLNVSVLTQLSEAEWDFGENAPLGGRIYINDASLDDTGIVIFFDKDSDYLVDFADCETFYIQCALECTDPSDNMSVGEPNKWYTMDFAFNGLEEYKTSDEPAVDEPATDEPIVDEPVVDEPIVDEPITDEPVVDEPVVDEPITDEPVVDEPIVDEPITDEPVVDEPVVDEPITDEPVVDTNFDVDSGDKTSPDTGMGGIAAVAAVSITALGAAILSKKRK